MYRDLFDSNQAPILIVDRDGFVVEANAAAQHAFGRSAASAAARSAAVGGHDRTTGGRTAS